MSSSTSFLRCVVSICFIAAFGGWSIVDAQENDLRIEPPSPAESQPTAGSVKDNSAEMERRDEATTETGEMFLVLFDLPDDPDLLTGTELTLAEEKHRRILDQLIAEGAVTAYGRFDDGAWIIFMRDARSERFGKIFMGDPLYRDYRVRVAVFTFTVGRLTGDRQKEANPVYQLVAFTRDPSVLDGAGPMAEQPFGAEVAGVKGVAAAGSWGFGHHGFLVLEGLTLEAARVFVDSMASARDPQWTFAIRELTLEAGDFVRNPPG